MGRTHSKSFQAWADFYLEFHVSSHAQLRRTYNYKDYNLNFIELEFVGDDTSFQMSSTYVREKIMAENRVLSLELWFLSYTLFVELNLKSFYVGTRSNNKFARSCIQV